MELYSSNDSYKLYKGDMRNMLDVIKKESIDAVLTDPPYELNFMGKGWDNSGIAFQPDTWKKCYEVLKPGGYLLAFGGSRTFHRIACAIEDAGFEIRDTIMWIYGSGFPKSQNIGKMYDKKMGNEREIVGETKIGKTSLGDGSGWDTSQNMKDIKATGKIDITKGNSQFEGWGSALKPSYEPIIVARKPFKGSLVDNVIEYGVGGINIDECRVGNETISIHNAPKGTFAGGEYGRGSDTESYRDSIGRFPANTILTYDETDFDEVCGGFPQSKGASSQNNYSNGHIYRGQSLQESKTSLNGYREWYNDNGSASRYFYCAKASKKDRDEGLDEFEDKEYILGCNGATLDNIRDKGHYGNGGNGLSTIKIRKNTHPTVKPTDLMQYLVRLVTPNGGTVLDPFNGSGSTGKAVMYENKERNKNYKYIGIELTEEYLPIAKARIEYVMNNNIQPEIKQKEEINKGQISIFDVIEG